MLQHDASSQSDSESEGSGSDQITVGLSYAVIIICYSKGSYKSKIVNYISAICKQTVYRVIMVSHYYDTDDMSNISEEVVISLYTRSAIYIVILTFYQCAKLLYKQHIARVK